MNKKLDYRFIFYILLLLAITIVANAVNFSDSVFGSSATQIDIAVSSIYMLCWVIFLIFLQNKIGGKKVLKKYLIISIILISLLGVSTIVTLWSDGDPAILLILPVLLFMNPMYGVLDISNIFRINVLIHSFIFITIYLVVLLICLIIEFKMREKSVLRRKG